MLSWVDPNGACHRSPFELDIEKRDYAELIMFVLNLTSLNSNDSLLLESIWVSGVSGVCNKKDLHKGLQNEVWNMIIVKIKKNVN